MLLCFIVVSVLAQTTLALNNGLALTPPMGWLSWERFRCNVDCVNDPDNCISENLYMKMADLMVSEGFKDAGYVYVNIDDCWPSMQRDDQGRLVADPKRFPSGIKALAKYVHDRGLKLGIYEDFGHLTCAGYPGSEFYMETDANTFASWDVDMLKFDGCNSDPKDMPYGYPIMQFYLNKTGHPMVFSCEWPLYEWSHKLPVPDYAAVRSSCNQWRNYHDVQDSWASVTSIVDYYGDNTDGFAQYNGPGGWNDPDMSDYGKIAQACNLWRNFEDVTDSWPSVLGIVDHYGDNVGDFASHAGPGAWNDPDMLAVGDFGLSYYQQKAQFGMWALFSAPLFMSLDLRNMDPNAKALLLNRHIIAINQDPAGHQATRLFEVPGSLSVWLKPMSRTGLTVVGLLNKDNQGRPLKYKTSLSDIGFQGNAKYNVTEAFENKYVSTVSTSEEFITHIDPTSIYIMLIQKL